MTRTIGDLELVGNALCLDFANTINSRRHQPGHDYIATGAGLAEWAGHVGLGTVTAPRGRPAPRAAHRLRDDIYGTFSAIAAGADPAPAHLNGIHAAHTAAVRHATLGPVGDRVELTWPPADRPAAVLWPVAHSAVRVLAAGAFDRIHECPGCGWVFLDRSRNGARRWCSMRTCGSRDKMRRFYQRHRD